MKGLVSTVCLGFVLCLGPSGRAANVPDRWNSTFIEGGFMFRDLDAFRGYLLEAESVAVGRLSAWDGKEGKVRVEKVYRGAPGKEPSFTYSGGMVSKPSKGDKVLILLGKRKGQVVLHSFCAASGLFPLSSELGKLVEKLLPAKK